MIEYGSVETGAMAYSRPGDDALTFVWDSFACQAAPDGELLVTCLHARRFPLVNHATGDVVEPLTPNLGGAFRCARIVGRTKDVVGVPLAGGRSLPGHAQVLISTVTPQPEVRGFQALDRGGVLTIRLALRPGAGTPDEVGARIVRELAREFPDLDRGRVRFEPLLDVRRTAAGKQPLVVRE